MVVEESTCNGELKECGEAVPCLKDDVVVNGFANGTGSDVAEGSSGESLRTYKRRKRAKLNSEGRVEGDGMGTTGATSQFTDQVSDIIRESFGTVLPNNSCEQVNVPRMDSHAFSNGSADWPQGHWRNIVLESMYQAISESAGGIRGCIQDALVFHAQNDCMHAVKESIHYNEDRQKYPSQTGWIPGGSQKAAEGHLGATSNGTLNGAKQNSFTELCQRAFFNILVSEKFAALCKLLFENFEGIKVEKFFNYALINTRMRDGVYEHSPELFSTDIQQVWGKLQFLGTDIVSLATQLSDMSMTSCLEHIGGLVHRPSEEKKDEFCTQGSDFHSEPKSKQLEHYSLFKVCTCRCCGEKADGRDFLVCDSCEEMYHVSCIEPPVQEMPPKTWYCAACAACGIGSPHENCVVCEKLNALSTQNTGLASEPSGESNVELDSNSNSSTDEGSRDSCSCKVCLGEFEYGEKVWICSHSLCPSKYYHTRCLTRSQLKLYGPRWYCPSCLCRVCLTDRDDDKIVLCDGCDHAYHVYCMNPPLASIPRGKWFCSKCNVRILEVRKAKRAYGLLGKKQASDTKQRNGEGGLDKAEGVDMLLNAASTLSNEEKLASNQTKS